MWGRYYFALLLTVIAYACRDTQIAGQWMHVADYPDPPNAAGNADTSYLVLNHDSTFRAWSRGAAAARGWLFEGDYAGTWRLRSGPILELTLPARQEHFVMAYSVLRATGNQLTLQPLTPSADTGATSVIFMRVQ